MKHDVKNTHDVRETGAEYESLHPPALPSINARPSLRNPTGGVHAAVVVRLVVAPRPVFNVDSGRGGLLIA